MSAFLRYTLMRIALFLGAAVLLSLAGLDGLYVVLGALVLSSIASIFLLRTQRMALAEEVAARVERGKTRLDERTRREDHPED